MFGSNNTFNNPGSTPSHISSSLNQVNNGVFSTVFKPSFHDSSTPNGSSNPIYGSFSNADKFINNGSKNKNLPKNEVSSNLGENSKWQTLPINLPNSDQTPSSPLNIKD